MTGIAKLYGVGNRHVTRACDGYEIARLGTGHWQRLNHVKVVQAAFFNNKNFPPQTIVIVKPAVGKLVRVQQVTTMRPGDLRHDSFSNITGIVA